MSTQAETPIIEAQSVKSLGEIMDFRKMSVVVAAECAIDLPGNPYSMDHLKRAVTAYREAESKWRKACEGLTATYRSN